MANTEKYFYGQGRVFSRPWGDPKAKWRWWGDVSELSFSISTETVSHKESYSSKKGVAREFSIGSDLKLNGSLHQLDTISLAELLYGSVSEVTNGVVANEPMPDEPLVGDIIKLEYPGVSKLVITDSSATPVKLEEGKHYDMDPRFGSLEILELPTLQQPLKAAYEYSGFKQVNFLTKPQPILELRYEGINLAEGGEPTIVEFYKVGSKPLQELALITTGNDVAGTKFELSSLIDSSKPIAGTLGQFGRIITVN